MAYLQTSYLQDDEDADAQGSGYEAYDPTATTDHGPRDPVNVGRTPVADTLGDAMKYIAEREAHKQKSGQSESAFSTGNPTHNGHVLVRDEVEEAPPQMDAQAAIAAMYQQLQKAPERRGPEFPTELPRPAMAKGPGQWETALRSVADALSHRGQNIGAINDQAFQQNEAARQENNKLARQQTIDTADLATQANKSDPTMARIAAGTDLVNAQLRERALTQSDTRLTDQMQNNALNRDKKNQALAAGDPESAHSERARSTLIAKGVDPSLVEGRSATELKDLFQAYKSDIEHASAPRKAQDEAREAGMTSAASTGARIGTEGRMAGTSAQTAAAIEGAKGAVKIAQGLTEDQLKNDAALAKAGKAYPGVKVEDQEAWAQGNSDQVEARKVRSKVDLAQKSDVLMAQMADLMSGTGAAARLAPGKRQAEYDSLRSRYTGILGEANNTGVLNDREYKRMSGQVPSWSPDVVNAVTGAITGANVSLEQLKGARAANRDAADSSLTTFGAKIDWNAGSKPKAPAHGADTAASPNLGKTLVLPNGKRFTSYTDEQLKRALAAGGKLE